MSTTNQHPISKGALWTGRVLTTIAALFLAMDGVAKFFLPPEVAEANANLGLDQRLIIPLAILQLVCLALYLFPRTAILGAILLTGYLGGAVAIHVRVGNPLFSHILFPTYLGIMLWGGLYLRHPSLRILMPIRQPL